MAAPEDESSSRLEAEDALAASRVVPAAVAELAESTDALLSEPVDPLLPVDTLLPAGPVVHAAEPLDVVEVPAPFTYAALAAPLTLLAPFFADAAGAPDAADPVATVEAPDVADPCTGVPVTLDVLGPASSRSAVAGA